MIHIKPHIDELRRRLTNIAVVLGIIFVVCFYFSNSIYSIISTPILSQLPDATQLITTKVTAPFMVPLQLSFICALLLSAPYIIYQIWMFISPGLYKKERKIIAPLIIFSCTLFYSGILFAVLIICPVALKFFTSSAPNGVTVMLDIADYLDFIVTIAFAAGLAFQIPIITKVLIATGVVSKQSLIAKRKHVIVMAFILGMILAPPDVISQIMLAIPMWLLFEIGLILSQDKTTKQTKILTQINNNVIEN